MASKGKVRVINYKYDDYDNLYDTNVYVVESEQVIVNDQVVNQLKKKKHNLQKDLKDLKVSDFSMANAMVTGLAASFKPVNLMDNDIDDLISAVSNVEYNIDQISKEVDLVNKEKNEE